MQQLNQKQKKECVVFLLAVFLVTTFFVFQGMEFSNGETATDQVNLSVTVAETISLVCTNPTFATLTPGTPITATTTCTTTTNANGGFDLKVKRDDATSTMDLDSLPTVDFPDRTVWNPTTPNATVWVDGTDLHLGFTVCSHTVSAADDGKSTTWWAGTATACDATSKYAGFPYHETDYYTIVEDDTYSSASSSTVIQYKVNAPSTQRSGAYSGTITYQAVSQP